MKSSERSDLSIQVGLYGLSFFLKSDKGGNLLPLDYCPEKGGGYLSCLQSEIKNLHLDELNLGNIRLFHHHPYQVFVPHSLYRPENEKDYLKTHVKVFKYDRTERDHIDSIQAVNVYIPFDEISNYLKEIFPGLQSFHSFTPFIEYALSFMHENAIQNAVFIRLMQHDFQMIVIRNSQLVLANTFPLESKDDLLFYALFVWEELQLENDSTKIFLTGQREDLDEMKKELETFKPGVWMKEKSEYEILSMYL